MLTRKTWIVLASVAATCLMATTVLSQESGPAPRHENRSPGRNMREMLGISEEQWKTLGPQVEKVQHLMRNAGIARPMGPERTSENLSGFPAEIAGPAKAAGRSQCHARPD